MIATQKLKLPSSRHALATSLLWRDFRFQLRFRFQLGVFLCSLLMLVACGSEAPEPSALENSPVVIDSPAPDPVVSEMPRRGLWVLCQGSQRVLDHPEKIPALIATAQSLGATDLFVQVYRGGKAWFNSSLADATPYQLTLEATQEDSLALLISAAHQAGLRVHGWVNVLSLASNRNAPFVRELGPEVLQVDRQGRVVTDYPKLELPYPDRRTMRMGTPAVWLDPAVPAVTQRLTETFAELIARYPDLDGLHLDYIRYPDVLPFAPGSRFGVGLDFGYGEISRQRFQKDTGLVAPLGDSLGNANRWDQWRRDELTGLVRKIRKAIHQEQPSVQLSAAVWAYPARAYLSLYQDWRGWLDEELLDFAVPMLYTLDDHLLKLEAPAYRRGVGGDRVWIGLGAWLFEKNPARILRQIEFVESLNSAGIVLFSYDAIADSPKLENALTVKK